MSEYIAIDIGGTRTRIARFPSTGNKPSIVNRISTQNSAQPILERLIELIDAIWPDNSSVLGIGVAAPGPVDPFKGVVIEAPNIPEWDHLPLKDILEDRFDVPVKLGNDGNLAALGEWKYGAGMGHHHMIYITVSTGIGGGIIVDDKLLFGDRGLASELGHVTIIPDGPLCSCGHHGHLEAIASGPAIVQWVASEIKKGIRSSLSSVDSFTAKDIAEAALNNDKLALSGFVRAGRYLGIAIANFLHIFNPSSIIIGGGVSRSGTLLISPLKQTLEELILSPIYLEGLSISVSPLGDNVGLMGALALIKT
jgi:glucokinase